VGWRLLVDRGGTFTDVVACGPDGQRLVTKLLSLSDAGDATGSLAGVVPPDATIDELRLGTTVATNALLERRGERVLLLTTRGFRDLLDIGNQARPDIFALDIRKRQQLHAAVAEIDERVLADGSVRRSPDPQAVARALAGWKHVAVLFLNAHANPVHELLVERVAHGLGLRDVSLSHRVSPGVGAVARGDTTVADAYLTPLLQRSLGRIDIGRGRVLCMQSAGGLIERARFAGKDAILSGPAGGVVATAAVGRLAGFRQVIGFDMGGTSTDVCRCGDTLERVYETVVDGITLRAPALPIVTVAAGGGSICSLRDGRACVGPESAGADPGPACYGRGGPATVTDCNLVLGRLRSEWFPHLPLDAEAARARLAVFGEPEAAARGFLAVAVASMADALRRISVARGFHPAEHALVAFGGAGGQHACELARALGMRHVLLHPLAGVLSAWGLQQAPLSAHAVAPVAAGCDAPSFPEQQALAALGPEDRAGARLLRRVDVGYVGSDTTLDVPWNPAWREHFEQQHERLFGFRRRGHALQLVAARVEALVDDTSGTSEPPALAPSYTPPPDDPSGPLPVYVRSKLLPGARLEGPALVVEPCATTVVEAGWSARVDGQGLLVLEDGAPLAAGDGPSPGSASSRGTARDASAARDNGAAPDGGAAPDPVMLEVMSNRFMAIAEQMGEHLRRVAHSTNIKERLDFSCALFDARGDLVANAPHIPVHLGAMSETVRGLLARQTLRPGDAWLSNDPYGGGSHLPDLTVVSPVFREGALAFFVANRGHHADVGGKSPGSMPPDSHSLAEEGALFADTLLLRDGELREEPVAAIFRAAGTRGVAERLADLRAQVACNVLGVRLLDELCAARGTAFVQRWMALAQDNAEAVMREVVAGLRPGRCVDRLDDGSIIAVEVRREGRRAVIDFAGCSLQHAGNRNAPRSVACAAVLYVFRSLAARAIPLNAGCLRPLDIRIPPGSLLDPQPPAAVVGGNVETSQRLVDVLYGALGRLAAAQGTMNNLTFGTRDGSSSAAFGYYETVCGGAGAGPGWDGASAVQTHMTNTRITDPEVLEQRYPVLVRRFALRRGSGGAGVWRGGDGVVRTLEFLRPLEASMLAERRACRPFGLRASAGAAGRQRLSSRGVLLRTPGGGGYSPSAIEWAGMPVATARQLFRQDRWRGPTHGIARGAVHARLLLLHAQALPQLRALAGRSVLFAAPPGATHWADDAGEIDLARDLPLYVLHDDTGAWRNLPQLPALPQHVFVVLDPDGPGLASLPRGAVRGGGAPGRRLLLARPVG